ncbi:MAG: thiamine pyrophosphate-dependent dehydrogenase E1 component subunit alpha [Acidimicrobiia bacterium]
MALIRAFETRVEELYLAAAIPGFVHVSLGQEACAVGVCFALGEDDYLTSTHRGHGHCLARGMAPDRMMAELFGRATGYCGGKGGSMHIADPTVGVLGANGIVGAGLPIAVGAGTACQLRGSGVAVAFFGEGATTTGAFHEAMIIAAVSRVPVLFVCENNRYVEFSAWSELSTVDGVADRAESYGIEALRVDGNDVTAVYDTASALVSRLRGGEGPLFLELDTYRISGHYVGDPARYRPEGEAERVRRERDPLALAVALLRDRGVVEDDLSRAVRVAAHAVEAAVRFAEESPFPDASEVTTDV